MQRSAVTPLLFFRTHVIDAILFIVNAKTDRDVKEYAFDVVKKLAVMGG